MKMKQVTLIRLLQQPTNTNKEGTYINIEQCWSLIHSEYVGSLVCSI